MKGFSIARHEGEEQCECGGDFCGCPNCSELLGALIAGKRKASETGCRVDIEEWTEEHGIGKAHEP